MDAVQCIGSRECVCVCVQWLDTLCIPTNWQTISIICATANSANKFIINFPWIQSKISTFVVWFRVSYIYRSWCYVSVLRCKLIGIFSFDSDRRFGGHFNVFLCVCVCVSHSLFRFHSAFPFFPLVLCSPFHFVWTFVILHSQSLLFSNWKVKTGWIGWCKKSDEQSFVCRETSLSTHTHSNKAEKRKERVAVKLGFQFHSQMLQPFTIGILLLRLLLFSWWSRKFNWRVFFPPFATKRSSSSSSNSTITKDEEVYVKWEKRMFAQTI